MNEWRVTTGTSSPPAGVARPADNGGHLRVNASSLVRSAGSPACTTRQRSVPAPALPSCAWLSRVTRRGRSKCARLPCCAGSLARGDPRGARHTPLQMPADKTQSAPRPPKGWQRSREVVSRDRDLHDRHSYAPFEWTVADRACPTCVYATVTRIAAQLAGVCRLAARDRSAGTTPPPSRCPPFKTQSPDRHGIGTAGQDAGNSAQDRARNVWGQAEFPWRNGLPARPARHPASPRPGRPGVIRLDAERSEAQSHANCGLPHTRPPPNP